MNKIKKDYLNYVKVEKSIELLADKYHEQPDLSELAAQAGLSASHFQRVFTQWAGVSPKKFLQYVTKEHALRVLRKDHSVLETSDLVGLSGAGRLYDLTVTLDAVTPGEVASRGESLVISYGVHKTPYGECFIAITDRGICKLAFGGKDTVAVMREELSRDWENATFVERAKKTEAYIETIFSGNKSKVSLAVTGTNFQLKVWEALLRVPVGAIVSYDQLARAVAMPKASRAVGTAVGKNPVALLIPCHRVIRKTGVVGNYRWGTPTKLAILGREAVERFEAKSPVIEL